MRTVHTYTHTHTHTHTRSVLKKLFNMSIHSLPKFAINVTTKRTQKRSAKTFLPLQQTKCKTTPTPPTPPTPLTNWQLPFHAPYAKIYYPVLAHTADAATLRMDDGWFLQNIPARSHDVTLHWDSKLQSLSREPPRLMQHSCFHQAGSRHTVSHDKLLQKWKLYSGAKLTHFGRATDHPEKVWDLPQ
jgi:hypothetical protein